jgi:hypothetical protein
MKKADKYKDTTLKLLLENLNIDYTNIASSCLLKLINLNFF